jgi:chloramphenicol O-acetyltransferase type A
MRKIDLHTWPRREHFNVFRQFNHPHFGMCANMDVTAFLPMVKARGYSLTVTVAYVIARVSNSIPAFCCRIRDNEVVEHETVHPSVTILVDDELFTFCTVEYQRDFEGFSRKAAEAIVAARAHPTLTDPDRDDLLYMTAIPWVSFTSFVHAMQYHPQDSVPRFAWGKIFDEDQRLQMPLAVQGHHALMDGLHMGRLYEQIQDCLRWPEAVCGEE